MTTNLSHEGAEIAVLADAKSQFRIASVLTQQKRAQLENGPPNEAQRVDRLDRAISMMLANKDAIVGALNEDFGSRSPHASLLSDVAGCIGPLKHARDHLRHWMKRERRKVTPGILGFFGARAYVEYQPKGTVGVISPWNFPFTMALTPLAGIFAAGNRAMLKPSEFTPASSALLQRLFAAAFDESEVAVLCGSAEIGMEFSGLPFDHLLFTGSTSVARDVMRAAAMNLVPVTLELGGKSPVIMGESANLELAAKRIMLGKTLNSGQICLAPDYVLIPEKELEPFVAALQRAVRTMYPTLKENPDYTSILNKRHYDRLRNYLDDARSKGADIREINPGAEDFRQQAHFKIPPTLLLNVSNDMLVMKDEIFGPLLPIKTYQTINDAIHFVNCRARPLSLYYFGTDRNEQKRVLRLTTSGGVTVNDVIMHIQMDNLPFGGIGPSGMGAYHGFDGFKTFSHAKAVFEQTKADITAVLRPPYGRKFTKLVESQLKR